LFEAIEKFDKENFLAEVSAAYKLSELKESLLENIKTSQ
jgi:hypothetical protein